MKDKEESKVEEKKSEEEKPTQEASAIAEPSKKASKVPKSVLDPEEDDLAPSGKDTDKEVKTEKENKEKPVIGKGKEIEKKEKSSRSNTFLIIGIIAGLVVLTAGGVFFLLNLKSNSSGEAVEESVEPTPSPTPELTLKRGEITFEVLNASTTSGLAKKGAEKLETLGYKIGKIGNYSGEVKENELYLSQDLMEKKEFILKDLEADFKISTVSGELKEATSSGRIILVK